MEQDRIMEGLILWRRFLLEVMVADDKSVLRAIFRCSVGHSIRFFYYVVFLLLSTHISSAQKIDVADSLIESLQSSSISKTQRFEILRRIAHLHPDYNTALSYSKESLKLAKEIENPLYQAKALEEIGINERLLGNYSKSVSATLKALSIFDSLGENTPKAAILVQLGSNAISDENYSGAIKYLNEAKAIYESVVEPLNHALTLLNLGEAYRMAAEFDSAIHYFNKALILNDSLDHHIVGSYALGNLGMTYNAIDDLKRSRENLALAIDLVRELGDPYSTSVYLAELGQVNQKENSWNQAELNYKEALEIAKGDGLKEQIRDISAMMVEFYQERKQFNLALKYQQLFQVYQDSLVNKENIQQVEQIKARYEIDKRESEIALLGEINVQQRRLTYGLAFGVLMFVVFTYLLYQGNQQKRKANKLLSQQKDEISAKEEEKALLLKELNHRVKNNLQMIASLLNLQGNELIGHPAEESIKAGKLRVEALSLIHQKLYREDLYAQVSLPEYIDDLVLNLFYSYNASFKPDLDIEPIAVNIDKAIPIALIINELVTNSLKYAFEGIENPEFKVRLKKVSEELVLVVSDNGIGFDRKIPETKTSSFGIKLINSLVRQLEGNIEHQNDHGTSWILTFNHNL